MKESYFFDNGQEVPDLSETFPEQFIVTDKELDQDVYEQFMTGLEWIDPQPDYASLILQGEQLADKTMSISQKKLALVQLARWGTAGAYRLVQKYCTRPDSGLEEWSRIAMYECQMRLEQEMLDEPVGLVSTGLGGQGERLRFIFVLALQEEASAEGKQQEVQGALDKVCQRYRSIVESTQFQAPCLQVQALVPLDVAVGKVIEEIIVSFNREQEEFCQDYLVTNVSVPTEEEIREFLGDLYRKQRSSSV